MQRIGWIGLVLITSAVGAAERNEGEIFGAQISTTGIKHSFLVMGSITAIIDEDSRISWLVPGRSRDGHVLANGNVLVSTGKEIREYQRASKEVVFRHGLGAGNTEMGTVVRLDTGNTMLVERGANPCLLELDPTGKVVVSVPLQPETPNAHMQTREARKLPTGNYLVPHLLAFAVKEYAPDGTIVRVIRTDLEELGGRPGENWPFTAIRLADGNTLVHLTHGNKIAEFDSAGKVAWKVDNSDLANRLADPCGGQRLPNGNTVICNYGQKAADQPKILEVTRDKTLVWEYRNPQFTGAHEIHVLTTNGQPTSGPPLR